MKTQRYYPYLWALLLALATFSLACGSNGEEETTDPSDNVMYTTPDAEDANYDNEVTVEQATPFSEETAVASEESTASRDFGTQPGDGETESKELEYFDNEYKKAYSPSTTDQRATKPGFKESPESGNVPPYDIDVDEQAKSDLSERKSAKSEADAATRNPESAPETTTATRPDNYNAPATSGNSTPTESEAVTQNDKTTPTRSDWSRDDNPTDYVKPEPAATSESDTTPDPTTSSSESDTAPESAMESDTDEPTTAAGWRDQVADRYLEQPNDKDAMTESTPVVYDPTIYTVVIWNAEAVSDEWPYGEPAYRNLSALDAPPLYEEDCMNELGYDARMECSHDALETYFYEQGNYPEEAREEKNEGRAFVTFVLDKRGQVVPASAELTGYNGDCTGCKDEALRLVREMPQWENPAYLNGRAVATQITVPIQFAVRIND